MKLFSLLLLSLAMSALGAHAQYVPIDTTSHSTTIADEVRYYTDSTSRGLSDEKQYIGNIAHTDSDTVLNAFITRTPSRFAPYKAAVEVFAINAGVWAFDRFVLDSDYSQISIHTVKHNIRHGFVWDNDKFSTNLLAHPYHGSLYFNAARSQGLGFWQSVPYAAAGSLMWEFCGEREPAAINDWIATTVGGTALGEITHRISALCLDESKRGWQRVGREALAFAVSPLRGINRLLSGDMWRVRHGAVRHDFRRLPVHFSLGVGTRYLADKSNLFRGEHAPFLTLNLNYGDPLGEALKPYDYFAVKLTSNLTGNQPLVSEVNLIAQLYARDIRLNPGIRMRAGLYQHFNYYDSEPVLEGSEDIPFKLSEAAAFGPGFIFRVEAPEYETRIEQQNFASLILLGGNLTDHYRLIDRNYNLASGFSLQSNTLVHIGSGFRFALRAKHYHLFTWKGYNEAQLASIDPLYLNAQGDKSRTWFNVVHTELSFPVAEALRIGWNNFYYTRNTNYRDFPDSRSATFETRLALYWTL